MIRGTDGLDYQDLTEKLLGNPAKTARNDFIITLRAYRRIPEQKVLERADYFEQRGDFGVIHTISAVAGKITGRSASFVIIDELTDP